MSQAMNFNEPKINQRKRSLRVIQCKSFNLSLNYIGKKKNITC